MPRIPPIDNIQFPQEEPAFFANMSTLFRTMAHRPELMQLSMQLLQAAMHTGTVEPALKELLAVAGSPVNPWYYWMASPTALARQFGVSEEFPDTLLHIST